MSRCVLRAPGGPIDLAGDALRERSRLDKVKRDVRAVVGEEPHALADDHGDDEQVDLVDELVLEQPPGQGSAAVHLQLTPRLALRELASSVWVQQVGRGAAPYVH